MAKKNNSVKKENLKTQPKVVETEKLPGITESNLALLGPASARCMVIKLSNGQELVALVADGKSHVDDFVRDVKAKEKDPKMRKAIMESFNKEISDTLSIKGKKMEDLIVVYYPMIITYGPMTDAKRQMGSLFLQPWVSPSMSTIQIFFLTKEQIVTMFEPTYHVKSYFSNAMTRLVFMITASMSQDAMAQIDPNSELGKLMGKLKNRGTKQEQEDQDDEYVAQMIAKSREPLKPESSETDQQTGKPPAVTAENNEEKPLPSVTIAGIKKTLH